MCVVPLLDVLGTLRWLRSADGLGFRRQRAGSASWRAACSAPAAGVYTVEWPSSQSMAYRAAGASRSTSRTVPERATRSVDSASATTRSPTLKVMGTSSFAPRPAYRPALAPDRGHGMLFRESGAAPPLF